MTTKDAPVAPVKLSRPEQMTIAVRALCKKVAFAPGIYGHERTQTAEMIVKVVLDALDTEG